MIIPKILRIFIHLVAVLCLIGFIVLMGLDAMAQTPARPPMQGLHLPYPDPRVCHHSH